MRQQEKEALQLKIQKIEEELTHQLHDWRTLGKKALWIGGTLAAIYLLIQSLPTTDTTDEVDLTTESNEEESSILWSVAQGVATSLLLAAAKETLLHLIDKLPLDHEA